MRAGRGHLPAVVLLAVLAGSGLVAGQCDGNAGGVPPTVSITLNAVEDDLNDLLVVPPGNFGAQVSYAPGGAALDLATFDAALIAWGGGDPIDVSALFTLGPTGAVTLVPGAIGLVPGTWTLVAGLGDVAGNGSYATYDFAIRDFGATPPIDTGQQIWLDFESDRDGTAGPDFALDLEIFGLGSPAAPALSDQVRQEVLDRTLARVGEAYYLQDPNGFGAPDPIDIAFSTSDPGAGDVTRICVGGPDPSGQGAIGNVFYDPGNSLRSSVECGTLPASGVFPREFDNYQASGAWKDAFDPVTAGAGGTPIGEHVLDPIVLDPGFDPGTASAEEFQRWSDIDFALQVFSDALGTVAAHEVAHAVGLVPPGAPGTGLHGGTFGPDLVHDVAADGSEPVPNYLMKQGGAFVFSELAGMYGIPRPFFRPLDFAYLRDRTLTVNGLNQLLFPPAVDSIEPPIISGSLQVTITGSGFASPVSVRFVNEVLTYNLLGEQVVSEDTITAWATSSQLASGFYAVEVENPDGQVAVLPLAVAVP